ncbi:MULTISPECIES: sulfotransferase family 2 domain-containing protein [Aequorivita]|uniref:Sulfotransferase family 2 domain-containing protein n=1 Tax=Aequorivita iocasae TaxID=2803865 RepID=A0ABX7DRL7_9FLAO|nr:MULTISPECIES: sulfotransferase family 2 domain-containing protein [Aequorivita]QQX76791.1 sulfotransferase family 2 domain-containing protein [Aequorivita iocasae]UCA56263.1 sulfotransferase family 2 domain-containing protein [Aequorivita sp. F7]
MIFFLHIPKTAGTTFYDVVKNNHVQLLKPKIDESPVNYLNTNLVYNNTAIRLPGGYNSAPQTLRIIEKLSSGVLKKIAFIGGHVGYGFHENYSEEIQYISFVRHPRERLFSDYKEHCKKGRYFYEDLRENNFEFNAYLKQVKKDGLDNILTRQLAGPFDFFLNERRPTDKALLERAKENCNSILFFELEHFDEALLYMKKQYGWKNINYRIRNQSSIINTDFEIDENLLNNMIKYDLELYSAIKTRRFKRKSFIDRFFGDKSHLI